MTRLLPCGLALAVSALAACNDPPTGSTPTSLRIVQAPSAVGVPGWELIDTLIVRAVDPSGGPREGVTATWTVRRGGGSIAPLAETTDADGYARAVWTLGDAAGLNGVRASNADGAQVEFESAGEAFRAERVASGWGIGCGLSAGAIWCWGDAFWGSGEPVSHNPEPGLDDLAPLRVGAMSSFVDVSVSGDYTVCGLDIAGSVWCAAGPAPDLSFISGLPPISKLAGSSGAHCGLAAGDSLPWCWTATGGAAQVAGVPALVGMWADGWSGEMTRCGLRADSTAICWGYGPLGDGSTFNSDTPVVVAGNHRFVELAVAIQFACGRTSAREVWCWGADEDGPPLFTPTLATSEAYSIGTDYHEVQALYGISQAVKWQGAAFGPAIEPTGLGSLPMVRQADNGSLTCLSLVDGQVYCYDEMFDGSGSPARYDAYSPVQPVRRNASERSAP